MRASITCLVSIFLAFELHAQSPQAFNYQGVARDAGGDAVVNTTIGVQFQLHQTTAVGTVVYSETHAPTTNEHGLFSVEVGNGTPGTGTFATIDWSAGPYFLEVGLDPAGGSSYTSVGTQQLLSVPYALYAGSVDMADDGDWVLSGDTLHNDGKRVGIGTIAPSTDLDVEGSFQLRDGTQADKKVLTSDADGNASWQNLSPEVLFGSGNVPSGTPACPTLAADITSGTCPVAIAFSGNHAYVLNAFSNNMMVFDITAPANGDVPIATIATGNTPRAVAVSGNYAYVVNKGSNNMMVFDISNPASPSLSATIATGTEPISIAASGDHTYVVNSLSDNMMVFNISNPASPSLSATIVTGTGPSSIAVSGNHAYVVNSSSNNMRVFDISNPASPSSVAMIATGTSPQSVAVSGNHAYVVNAFVSINNMMVFDISNPASPSSVATIATGTSPRSVAVSGNHAYVVNASGSSNNMMLFDISNPASPSLRATIATGNSPSAVAIQGNRAFVPVCTGGFKVFDLLCANDAQQVVYDPGSGSFAVVENIWLTDGDDISNGNSGNVGIGTTSPSAKLDVEGSFQLKDGTQGTSKLLTSDLDGNASWQDLLETDPQVGSNTTGYIPRWSGTELVTGSLFDNGSVGIGTDSPVARLHTRFATGGNSSLLLRTGLFMDNALQVGTLFAPANVALVFGENGNAKQAIIGDTWGNDRLRFFTASNFTDSRLTIIATGDVGIGTDAPTAKLSVNGTANKTGGGSWAVFSDRRLKKDISLYDDGLSSVLAINPVKFKYNGISKADTTTEYIGVIAQELEKVSPYMINTVNIGGTEYLEVDNSAMTYMLINAVKEQQKMIEELREQIESLNAANTEQAHTLEVNTILMKELQSILNAQTNK